MVSFTFRIRMAFIDVMNVKKLRNAKPHFTTTKLPLTRTDHHHPSDSCVGIEFYKIVTIKTEMSLFVALVYSFLFRNEGLPIANR